MEFEIVSPESAGVSSKSVLDFLKMLDHYQMRIHSVIMAKGNKIFAECYYAPIHQNFIHRMYSVSKSFVAMAVGMAVTEGLFSLDDSIVSFFPEFRNENTDEYFDECTVGDMLSMRSNVNVPIAWWGKYKSRVEAYYAQKTGKIPGTLYYYDSIGSFLLGCIVEKLTGKPFLEYLKEKVLCEIGFSKESYTLYEPGGFTVGDSGVMCTARDLLIFARFIMNKGEWGGKQYIDRKFLEQAICKQSDNNITGASATWNNNGYGYLIWKTHEDGFSLIGMGDQLAICDMKTDTVVVITADNQGDSAARHIIFHEIIKHFFPSIEEKALPENAKAHSELTEYLKSRKLLHQMGAHTGNIQPEINGKTYKDSKCYEIPFGIGENKEIEFSFGVVPKSDTMGFNEEGVHHCQASGAWTQENVFCIKAQIIDTYFGCLHIFIGFKGDEATLLIQKSGQYVLEGCEGCVIAKMDKGEIK